MTVGQNMWAAVARTAASAAAAAARKHTRKRTVSAMPLTVPLMVSTICSASAIRILAPATPVASTALCVGAITSTSAPTDWKKSTAARITYDLPVPGGPKNTKLHVDSSSTPNATRCGAVRRVQLRATPVAAQRRQVTHAQRAARSRTWAWRRTP